MELTHIDTLSVKNAKVNKTRKWCVHYYEYYFMRCTISCTASNLIVLSSFISLDCKMTTLVLEDKYNTHSNLIHCDRTFLAFIHGKVILIFREGSRQKQVWLKWEYKINRTTSLGRGVVPTKQTALWIRSSLPVYCSNSERKEQRERRCGEGTDLVALQGFSVSPQVPL